MAITPKLCKNLRVLWLLNNVLFDIKIYLPMKFGVDIPCSFGVMLRTKLQYETQQRAITPQLCKRQLWLLYTALFDIIFYLPLKFGVDIFCSFGVMLKIMTDGQSGSYMLSR